MFVRLATLFILVPLVELYLLIQVGSLVGVEITIGIVVVTGLVGAWLARFQGLKVLNEVRASLSVGEMPADALIDGLLILVAGAVLLTPGLLTDALGFGLLIPRGRRIVRSLVRRRLPSQISGLDPTVIDVEWRSDNS